MAILIDSGASPLLSGTPGDTHTLSSTLTGVVTYLWEIVSQPPGAPDTLSNPAAAAPTLITRKEGSYLIRLTATTGAGTTQETALLVNPSITSGLRVPAYAEIIEAGATGWDQGAGNMLRSLDLYREQAGVIACVANTTIAPGRTVTVAYDPNDPTGSPGAELKLNTLPGERPLPLAFADIDPSAPLVGIAIGTVSGGTASAGDVVLVRTSGLYRGLNISYIGTSDYPYLFPTGTGDLTDQPPTDQFNCRCVGKVLRWSSGTPGSGTVDIMVYGDRVPRIKSIEFGSTTGFVTTFPNWMSIGMVAPSASVRYGQFCPDLVSGGATILAVAKIWAATTGTSQATFQVKNANTQANIGSSFSLAASTQTASAGIWTAVDTSEPIGITGVLVSGSSSPQNIAATLIFWEL
jgi:hypothetical protein